MRAPALGGAPAAGFQRRVPAGGAGVARGVSAVRAREQREAAVPLPGAGEVAGQP